MKQRVSFTIYRVTYTGNHDEGKKMNTNSFIVSAFVKNVLLLMLKFGKLGKDEIKCWSKTYIAPSPEYGS